ncbi:hypothetical protein [Aporhodopirellula aestuarii]|uniref:Uncharacterized protein n=1 Tax=Aporhodopirellula aestuarii TaxID=2950107 RepID=A0ABT0UEE2_9BACT|nr:hypothetical protein [Aporhodopirellula aestuarii]MCM2375137.1 hypothetical protein [Aporhodopirellula aestuarii]
MSNPSARKTLRILLITTLVVWACGTIANFVIYCVIGTPESQIGDVLKRFDLGHEPSIPAFYSATLLLASGGILGFLGVYDKSDQGRRLRYWRFMAIVMTALAIDEAVMFHEMGDALMRMTPMGDLLYFSWIIPAGLFVIVVGLLNLRFILNLPPRTKRLILLSGVIFVTGAIGMESVAGVIFSAAEDELAAQQNIAHVISQSIEEALEMLGVVTFIFALLNYIESSQIKLYVRYENQE